MGLKELIKSITKKEWHYVILLSVLVILITTLPYLYAHLNAPEGYFYNGIHSIASSDTNVYFSYINQIKAGNFLIKDYFTSEEQIGVLNLFWLKVGLFAGLFDLSPVLAFQIFRIILIPLFVLIAYLFISYFFKNKILRQITLLFFLFSSGMGVYTAEIINKIHPYDANSLIYKWPIDLWVAESNIFLTLYQTPHFILSLTLMLAVFLLVLIGFNNNKYLYSISAGLLCLYWFNWHPYYFPVVSLLLFFYLLFLSYKDKKAYYWIHYLIIISLSCPFIIYHYFLIKTDFVIGIRAGQNITLSPPFIFTAIGFGFLLIFALAGIIILFKNRKVFTNDKYIFLLTWFIVGFFLIYSPIQFQRKLSMGLQVPMIFFSIIFLNYFFKITGNRFESIAKNKIISVFFFILLLTPSTVFNLIRDIQYYKMQNTIFYMPKQYIGAVNWLDNNNAEDKAILCYQKNGCFIPAIANQEVYLGHGHETIFYNQKKELVTYYFTNKLEYVQEKQFLKNSSIGYIFTTSLERSNGLFVPEDKDYLEQVFVQDNIEIYKVNL